MFARRPRHNEVSSGPRRVDLKAHRTICRESNAFLPVYNDDGNVSNSLKITIETDAEEYLSGGGEGGKEEWPK